MERLAGRHEALTQTVELWAVQMQETRVQLEARFKVVSDQMQQTDKRVNQVAGAVMALSEIVRGHEERLDKLEGTNGR